MYLLRGWLLAVPAETPKMSFPDRLSNPSMVPDVSASYPVNKSVSSRLEEDLYPRSILAFGCLASMGPQTRMAI